MRPRLRALRALLRPEPEYERPLTTMHLPATDEDGDRAWLEVLYAPTDEEIPWASHDCQEIRGLYAVLACVKARADSQANGWKVGWPDDA